jgi:fibronectin type 3 domain-containing protein
VDTLRVIYISANLAPPTGLVAAPGDSQVALRWSALAGATNYWVKRATSPGGPYTATNTATGLSFTNTALTNGTTYYYVVSAATAGGSTTDSFEVRATPFAGQLVHPGVMHTLADLDRMRTRVGAGDEPWLTGYHKLVADSHSSSAYAMQGPFAIVTRAGAGASSVNLSQWENDCGAAYQNALLWYLTGNPAHANKAIQILDAWSGTLTNINGSDARLTAGLQGHKFIAAAEIIRHTGAPWSPAQVNTCSQFIRNVLLPLNRMYGGGNWGIIGAISQMAAGVFLEDEAEFNDAVNALKYGAPIECDMGLVNYIDPAGWTTEADRDIGHWSLGLNNDAAGAQIAWCQGVDLWSFLSHRIQAGHEYIANYNASNSVTYIQAQQCDGYNNGSITVDGRGRWDIAFYEQAYHPYANLFGIASPWTWLGVTNTRAWLAGTGSVTYPGDNDGIAAEGYDRDHVAFGTLVAALPPRTAGLPVLPSGLVAIGSNAVVKLAWDAASGALTYNLKRAVLRAGPYTNLATGLAATSYTDATVANDQRYFYKVSAVNGVGETENSGLASAYPSAAPPAAPVTVSATTVSHQQIDLKWTASTGATSYNVARSSAPEGPFTSLATNVGTNFLIYADTGLLANTTFYYVLTANSALGTGVASATASATTLPLLPSPWAYADAGYLTTPGNATYTNGVFTVKAAGLDYSGFANSDSFGLCHLSLTGDGEIVARYASRMIYSNLGKIGLTLRESLGDDAKHMTVYIGDSTATMNYRTATGGTASTSGSVPVTGLALPQWLKLARAGNIFTGSVSSDGTNWTVINTRTNTMNGTLLAGLAVCSRNNGFIDTATFDHVTVTGVWPPAVSTTPVTLTTVVAGSTLQLGWPADHIGWRLEMQTNSRSIGLWTNWFAIPGSEMTNQVTVPLDATNDSVFYRLVY